MKFTILPYKLDDLYFFISPFTGNLVVNKSYVGSSKISSKTEKNIGLNNNPYQLKPLISNYEGSLSDFNMKKLNSYNNKLMWLGNNRFFLSCLYSRLSMPLFENTLEAFDHIAKLKIHQEKKGKICLQRSLLAAKTSKSFKKNGTLFIGAQFPTGIMHAWIIENGIQPDRQDREWIMYKPLLAITF
jgi:hypothetical protein